MEANVGALDLSDDLINQFCAVTGADREIGRQLLEICHGNLEMAIGMHMDQEEAAAADQPSGSAAPTRSQPRRLRFDFDSNSEPGAASTACGEDDINQNGLRAPIPQRHEVLVEEAPKFGFRGRRRGNRSVFDGFRDFQAEARHHQNMQVSGGRSAGKKHTLEDLFRPPIDITFKGTFHAARDRGKSENKWLLVNIQNVQEFSCQVLNRDIWSNFAIKTMVKKYFVFWQVYHDSEEGKKFMQFYTIKQWPHVAIIDPVTGENLVTWDKVDNVSFVDLLKDFLEDHPSPENPDTPPAKRQKRENSIVDESEEAQIEAAIRASLSDDHQPGTTSSASTIAIPSATAITSITDAESEQSEVESDELETFTGSEESSDAPSLKTRSRSRERASSSQPRNFSSVSAHSYSARAGSSSSNLRTQDGASSSSSAAGASGVAFSRLPLSSSTMEDTSMPSTSGSRDLPRVIDDSENENSLGFRESYANTPNSVDILGGRSWESHTLDSSSNSSSLVSSSAVTIDNEDDTVSNDRLAQVERSTDTEARDDATLWIKHFGDAADPTTNLVVRFPDGKKEQLSLPCSSKLQALFVFCSSKGFSQDHYELVVNFPRRTLSSLDPGSTISEARLHPQETVFVQAR